MSRRPSLPTQGVIWKYTLAALAGLILAYAVAGYVIVPWLAPGLAQDAIAESLRAHGAVGDVDLDPFAFRVHVTDFALDSLDGDPLLRIARFEANLELLDSLLTGAITLSHIVVAGLDLSLVVSPEGAINWLEAMPVPTQDAEAAGAETPKGEEPFALVLHQFELRDSVATFSDHSRPTALRVEIAPLDVDLRSLELGDVDGKDGAPLDVTLGLASGGRLDLTGQVGLGPPSAELEIDAEGLHLTKLSPIVEGVSRARVESGLLDVSGRLHYDGDAESLFDFVGRVAIHDLALMDAQRNAHAVGFEEITIEGIDVRSQPPRLVVETLRIDGPSIELSVEPGGGLNLARIASPPETASTANVQIEVTETEATSSAGAPPDPVVIRIGGIEVTRGDVHIVDQSVSPSLDITLSELTASVSDIATDSSGPIALALTGKSAPHAELSLSGDASRFGTPRSMDVRLGVRDMGLARFSPYAARYAGHPIEDGHMNLDLAYALEDVALQGSNTILVDGLELGDRVSSPNAPNVPVALAVELLKDKDGRIALDVPVVGDISDPGFSVLGILGKTLVKQLVKVTSQPFRILGAAMPGGSAKERVVFEAGSARLGAAEGGELRRLAQVLESRERLVLTLQGSASRDEDAPELARRAHEEQLIAVHDDRWWRRSSDGARLLTAPQRESALQRVYDGLIEEGSILPGVAGMAAGGEPAEEAGAAETSSLEARVIASMQVPEADLLELASARVDEVRALLLGTGRLQADRIADAEPVVLERAPRSGGGVRLSLDAL